MDKIELALLFDADNMLAEAVELYERGFEELVKTVANERDVGCRGRLLKEFQVFQDRAEELREFLGQVKEQERPQVSDQNSKRRFEEKWNGLVGLGKAKAFLREQVILPVRFPDLFQNKERNWKSVLLHGPMGVGKTQLLLALKDLFHEKCNVHLFQGKRLITNATDGQVELRNAFASGKCNTVILMDDIDLLTTCEQENHTWLEKGTKYKPDKSIPPKVKQEFLLGMRQIGRQYTGLIVIATTSKPWNIDAALRRRFDKRILCEPPNQQERAAYLKQAIPDQHILDCVSAEFLQKTENFSTKDLINLVQHAWTTPQRKQLQEPDFLTTPTDQLIFREPTIDDFFESLARYSPLDPQTDLNKFQRAFAS